MDAKEKHNKALDRLQEYKYELKNQIIEMQKLDQKSDFMRKWNEQTIKERELEVAVIQDIIKNLIRF